MQIVMISLLVEDVKNEYLRASDVMAEGSGNVPSVLEFPPRLLRLLLLGLAAMIAVLASAFQIKRA